MPSSNRQRVTATPPPNDGTGIVGARNGYIVGGMTERAAGLGVSVVVHDGPIISCRGGWDTWGAAHYLSTHLAAREVVRLRLGLDRRGRRRPKGDGAPAPVVVSGGGGAPPAGADAGASDAAPLSEQPPADYFVESAAVTSSVHQLQQLMASSDWGASVAAAEKEARRALAPGASSAPPRDSRL
jgi:hypothetical protein